METNNLLNDALTQASEGVLRVVSDALRAGGVPPTPAVMCHLLLKALSLVQLRSGHWVVSVN